MKSNRPLEECLGAWVPRHPSEALEQRLFAPERGRRARSPGGIVSVVPALLMVMLTMVGAWDGAGWSVGRSRDGVEGWRGLGLSNQLLGVLAGGDSLSRHNGFTRQRFDWTIAAGTHSSIGSSIGLETNSFRR